MTIAQQLAGVLEHKTRDKLTEAQTHAAKRCIIDWTCAALAGVAAKQVNALENALSDELDFGPSLTLTGRRAPVRTAALINGLASHIVEFDDIYAPGTYHPGSPTIAAALSAATGRRGSGLDLICAVIAGYEVSNRVARAMGTVHYRYWHTTGTVGTIGATAALSSIYNANQIQIANALATSATMAAGLQQAFRGGSEIKPLHAGYAADAAFIAVGLAVNGVVAAPDMFEGSCGLGTAMSSNVDWHAAIGDLQENTIEHTTIKIHGCCGHIFPALDGVLALQNDHGFTADEVVAVVIGAYSATVEVTGNYLADTPASAKFCLPFIVASGLIHGSIGLDAYCHERLTDRRVLTLMHKITVNLDESVEAWFPAQRAANVMVKLKDGTVLRRLQPHRVGDPELPLTDQQLSNKFIELTRSQLTEEQANQLLCDLWSLDMKPDLGFFYSDTATGAD